MRTGKSILKISIICWGLLFSSVCSAAPDLSKDEAKSILASMGYKNLAVGAVVNGVGVIQVGDRKVSSFLGALSSSNVAMVFAYGEHDGKPQEIEATLFYDKEHGWFLYEIDKDKRKAVRLWTRNGYKEVRAYPK